jgi:nitrogen fixation NifU-like protein
MDLYAYQILDHYKQPRNYGVLEGADASSEQANLSCGDKVTSPFCTENSLR